MDELLHSPLVRFSLWMTWHLPFRGALSQSSLQYRETHTDLSTGGPSGKWTRNKVLLRLKTQTHNSDRHQTNKHPHFWLMITNEENLGLKANILKWLNTCLIPYLCCSHRKCVERTKPHKNVNYSARCDTALNNVFHECCCWKQQFMYRISISQVLFLFLFSKILKLQQ